jgi:hypothetical protein
LKNEGFWLGALSLAHQARGEPSTRLDDHGLAAIGKSADQLLAARADPPRRDPAAQREEAE